VKSSSNNNKQVND